MQNEGQKSAVPIYYSGRWTFNTHAADNDLTGKIAEEGTVVFYDSWQMLDLSQMPTTLFLQLAGITDATSVSAPSFVVNSQGAADTTSVSLSNIVDCMSKGYSSSTHIYELEMPAYTFTYKLPDGKTHEAKVVFSGKGEAGFDSYFNTMSLMAVTNGISFDGNYSLSSGTLAFQAAQGTTTRD